ncbi:MAG TPA: PKD domain-containing protein, partial [Nitrosomonas europaea]|uniref:PKD domain-containing protein n=2 Tax=Nitrosomonas europaea TaxID=915 RepID=UPI0024935242
YIQIAAGESSGTISVQVYGDSTDEVDESVVLELYNPSNAVFPDGVNTLQVIGLIHDDDGAGNNLGLFVGNAEIVEGADGVTREVAVPVHLSRPSDQTLTFLYQTADGSATAGQDYIPRTGSVTFLPGQTLAAVIIPIIGDAIDEPSETFTLTVTPTAAIANGSDGATGTVTILDGDVVAPPPPPPAGVTVNAGGNATISEGSLFFRTITFIDDIDTNADGWTYSVNWGDGSTIETGSIVAGANSFDISRFFADGDAGHDVSVTVTDVAGDSDTQQFRVNVNNVAPTIALSGLPEVDAGVSYTLNLGAITDPGGDIVTSYIVNWGDGSSDTYDVAGEVTHIYSTAGSNIITVDLIDEDGTHTNASSLAVAVTVPAAGVSMNAGIDAVINEGSLFTRTITFSDGEDAGANGWTYSVNWGDGSVIETGSIAVGFNSFDISHFFVDGDANHDVSVTVTDVAGDSDTQQFRVNVNNVAPTIALSGLPEVDAGVSYTLNLGAITDPGDDTVISYIVNWGDGSSNIYDAAGEVTHTFAAEGNYTISVDLVDEDDTHTAAGTLVVAVNPVIIPDGVSVNAGIDAVIDEGSVFTRTITFSDGEDAGADGWTYSVNWGDGSTIETGSIAAGANSFDISHFFADGDVGHDVSVTVTDVAGDSDTQQFRLNVNNVAPTLSIAGADDINEGGIYVLAITATDPAGAADPLTYSIDWGDGSSLQSLAAAELAALGGNVEHVYADDEDGPVNATPRTITVTVNDGDGGVTARTQTVTVHNVAPVIAVSGAATQIQGTAYALSLGAITDPGIDTVTSYIVNWGDGNIDSYDSAGEVSHIYANTGDFVIAVDLIDEDGTHTEVATQAVAITVPSATLSFEAGADATIAEGGTFTRTIVFSDGEDNGVAGWSYSIDYGDGTIDTGITLEQSLELSHLYADGDANHTVTVTLTDEEGEAVSDSFAVRVDNIAPVIALSGLPEVDAGVSYTLDLGAITDPGNDTVISYIVNWGDGSSNTYDAAGEVTHTFAAEGNYTISVDLVDEDDTHTAAGTLAVAVNPVIIPDGVSVNAGTDAIIDEGSIFTRTITFSDGEDNGAAGWNYSIDWNDGTVIETGNIAAGANSFDISRFFADGDAAHDISVTVTDVAGDSDTRQFRLDVNNVAPVIALSGLSEVNAGANYVLNLGDITDPGVDTVTSYIVNWGDNSSDVYDAAGEVTHTFAAEGNYTISVNLVDEDGTYADAGNWAVTVNEVAPVEVVRIGDAPGRVTNTTQLVNAWSDQLLDSIVHKSDATNPDEAWTPVTLGVLNTRVLAGGDLYAGDLGVSGQSMATSTVAQELDGNEVLRFEFNEEAISITANLTRFYSKDMGSSYSEAGRMQLFDKDGVMVDETIFVADALNGQKTISISPDAKFTAVEFSAGIYDGDQFIFGALASEEGTFGTPVYTDSTGALNGSDFLIDWIEPTFEISLVGHQDDILI